MSVTRPQLEVSSANAEVPCIQETDPISSPAHDSLLGARHRLAVVVLLVLGLARDCFFPLASSPTFLPQMAACVLYLPGPWLNIRQKNCDLSKFTSRFSEDPLSVTEEQRGITVQITAYPTAAERKLLHCKSRHRRGVVRAQLRLWLFELPDSPPDQDSGRSGMSDSTDSYQSEERIAQRPTPFVRGPLCPGHVKAYVFRLVTTAFWSIAFFFQR